LGRSNLRSAYSSAESWPLVALRRSRWATANRLLSSARSFAVDCSLPASLVSKASFAAICANKGPV
jgi:hypothetical protein